MRPSSFIGAHNVGLANQQKVAIAREFHCIAHKRASSTIDDPTV